MLYSLMLSIEKIEKGGVESHRSRFIAHQGDKYD